MRKIFTGVSYLWSEWRRKIQCFGGIAYLGGKSVTSSFATEDSEEKVLLQKKLIVEPFAFSQSKDGSTEFELFFRTTVSEYRYILHVKRDIVLYESLDRVKLETGRKSALLPEMKTELF